MHLLQSGVDISVIALWLGHESPTTTHQYIEADLAMKEKALSRLQVVAAFEKAAGRKYRVRHVPVPVLTIGHRLLGRIKPDLASIMGMALFFDTHPGTWDDTPLRQAGIDPRPATEYIQRAAGSPAH